MYFSITRRYQKKIDKRSKGPSSKPAIVFYKYENFLGISLSFFNDLFRGSLSSGINMINVVTKFVAPT